MPPYAPLATPLFLKHEFLGSHMISDQSPTIKYYRT